MKLSDLRLDRKTIPAWKVEAAERVKQLQGPPKQWTCWNVARKKDCGELHKSYAEAQAHTDSLLSEADGGWFPCGPEALLYFRTKAKS